MTEAKRDNNWFFSAELFGEELRRRRKNAGYSRERLSEAIEKKTSGNGALKHEGFSISPSAIRKWEGGISVPTVDCAVALMFTLDQTNWRENLSEAIMCGVAIPCLKSTLAANVKQLIQEIGDQINEHTSKVNSAYNKAAKCNSKEPFEQLLAISNYRLEVEQHNAFVDAANREIKNLLDGLVDASTDFPQFEKHAFSEQFAQKEQEIKREYMLAHPEEFSSCSSPDKWDVF